MSKVITTKICNMICIVVAIVCFFKGIEYLMQEHRSVSVKGLSERVVKADLVKLSIQIDNDNSSLQDLYKKRTSDKNKVLAFLQKYGFNETDVVIDASSRCEYSPLYQDGQKVGEQKRFFAHDIFVVSFHDIDKAIRMKSDINSIGDDLIIKCDCAYSISNFQSLKADMANEAAKNARDCAEILIKPAGAKIDRLKDAHQSEMSITSEDPDKYREHDSPVKRVRFIVNATFYIK